MSDIINSPESSYVLSPRMQRAALAAAGLTLGLTVIAAGSPDTHAAAAPPEIIGVKDFRYDESPEEIYDYISCESSETDDPYHKYAIGNWTLPIEPVSYRMTREDVPYRFHVVAKNGRDISQTQLWLRLDGSTIKEEIYEDSRVPENLQFTRGTRMYDGQRIDGPRTYQAEYSITRQNGEFILTAACGQGAEAKVAYLNEISSPDGHIVSTGFLYNPPSPDLLEFLDKEAYEVGGTGIFLPLREFPDGHTEPVGSGN